MDAPSGSVTRALVDNVLQRLPSDKPPQLLLEHAPPRFEELGGECGGMRREDHAWEPPEPRLGRQRLVCVSVRRGWRG